MKKSVYEATTDMFIKRCEARIAAGDLSIPWKKTWDPSLGMPRNMVSGKAYRGSNVFFTLIQGYTSPFWLTRKQVKALGGEIKTQEDGSFEPYTPITFWWFPDRNKPKDEGRIPFAKFYQVWNTEQVSGIEDKVAAVFADMGTGEPVNPIAEAQAIVDGWKTGGSGHRGRVEDRPGNRPRGRPSVLHPRAGSGQHAPDADVRDG
jgi:antirestriction protein ArdC